MLQSRRKTRRRIAAALGGLALSIAPPFTTAASKTWDLFSAGANNGLIDNAAGTWNTLTLNWSTDAGATNTTWSNNDDAVFGGASGVGLAGTVTLSGTQSANSVRFNPTAGGNFTLSGGTLNLTGAGGFITANSDASIDSILTSSNGLTKLGAVSLTLNSASTIGGTVAVNNGWLILSGSSGALASASSYTINAAATLFLNNTSSTNSNRLATAPINMHGGTLAFTGAPGLTESTGDLLLLSGANVIDMSGSGTTTLAFGMFNRSAGASVNFKGVSSTRRINFSSLTLDSFVNAGAYAGGSNFAWYDSSGYVRPISYGPDANTATTMTFFRHVRLTSSETKTSISVLTLNLAGSGVNLNFSNNSSITISMGGLIKSGGGNGAIQSGNELPGTLTTGSSGVEWIIRTDSLTDVLTISKKLVSGSGVTKTGAGALILNNAGNTYNGTTTIAEGSVGLGTAESIPNTSSVIVGAGAVFDVNGKTETIAGLTVRGGGWVASGSAATVILDGNTGSITGSATSGTGLISVNTLWLANLDSAAAHAINVADGEADVDLNIDSLVQNGVASAQGIDKTGTGTLRLGAINAYTGPTNINAGTLQLDGSTALASVVNVNSAGTLTGSGIVNGNATLTGNGVINLGPSAIIAGTLNASGGHWVGDGNVYGITTVSGGTFTVTGTTSGTNPINVQSGGTLAGTGTINKTVNVNAGGTIAPTGSFTATNVTLNPGAAYVWHLSDADGSPGGGYDTITVAGTLNINAGTTSGTQVTIRISAAPGQLQNWNPQGLYSWDVAIAGGVSGFASTDQFVLDTTDFEDDYVTDSHRQWQVEAFSGGLRITYAPEPSSVALLAIGAMGLLKRRRR